MCAAASRPALILLGSVVHYELDQLRTRRRPARRQPGGTENDNASSPPSEGRRKTTRRLSPTDPLNPDRVADPPIQFTAFIHWPCGFSTQELPRRRNFTPPQPVSPATSSRDFISGACSSAGTCVRWAIASSRHGRGIAAQAAGAIEAFKKTWPAKLAAIAHEHGVDPGDIELWRGDEARIGQKNKICPPLGATRQPPFGAPSGNQRTASTYIFGAICPREGKACWVGPAVV